MTVNAKAPVSFRLKVRMPGFTEDGFVKVSRGGSAKAAAGEIKEATRAWQDGDTVTCTWKRTLRTAQGFHQGVYVMLGDVLLTRPAGDDWAVAACGQAKMTEDGRVLLPVADVSGWKAVKGVPSGLPVLPETKGEVRMAELTPYAGACGISLFPRRSDI